MKTQIWAHRGASAYAPENTLEAFQLAIDMKADGIELDVYLTADGQLAVIHDSTIDRTTNGTGSGKVAENTLSYLRQFSYSAGFGDKFGSVKIPTLGDVYDLMYASGLTINVELKASGDEFLRKVYACEVEHKMQGRIVYSSFGHFNLTAMLELDPNAFVAPLYGDNIVKPWCYADSFGAKALHPHLAAVYQLSEYVEKSHELGVRVHPWTVDGEEDIRRLIALGVDALITNRPDVARRVRDGADA